jgi:hypothetical protein
MNRKYSLQIVLLLSILGCLGCEETDVNIQTISFDVMDQSQLPPSSNAESGLIPAEDITLGPQGYWIRSEAGLNRLGYQTQNENLNNDFSKIDWTKQDLFIVTLGVQGTTGHKIRFHSIEIHQDRLRISIQHLEPTSAVGEALTHPSAMVRINKQESKLKPLLNINDKDAICNWHILE